MLIVIHANKGSKCFAVTSSASEKKHYEKARGQGRYVTMISLLFPAEADKSTLTHHLVAQMANSKLKLVSHILIQNILSFYAD